VTISWLQLGASSLGQGWSAVFAVEPGFQQFMLALFLLALFLLGVGWNFLFTGSTTLSLQTYAPEEKDRAQGALNFFVFATTAVSSFASGVLVTTQGWQLLNWGSLAPVLACGAALIWLARHQSRV